MSAGFDESVKEQGTRFKLYPQAPVLEAFREPEIVWVSRPAGSVGPGPADDRMYVVDAIDKQPYEFPYLPPYRGATLPPAQPDEQGHFDYLDVNSREFLAAHMYGIARRILDIWEDYFDKMIEWHFEDHYARLELIPMIDWDNAQTGYGFIETGYGQSASGDRLPHCLNFDVLAHELGHSIIFSEVGYFQPTLTGEHLGFHESAADLVALVSVLHFDSVVDHLLERTKGNLYGLNKLNRIGELSETEQVRIASNVRKMSEFAQGWNRVHDLSEPLTGAVFDIFVDVFHQMLYERGLIGEELAALSFAFPYETVDLDEMQARFSRAYEDRHAEFKNVLLDARDYMGNALATAWRLLPRDYLSYLDVAEAFLQASESLTGPKYEPIIVDSFRWRGIGSVEVGPRLSSSLVYHDEGFRSDLLKS